MNVPPVRPAFLSGPALPAIGANGRDAFFQCSRLARRSCGRRGRSGVGWRRGAGREQRGEQQGQAGFHRSYDPGQNFGICGRRTRRRLEAVQADDGGAGFRGKEKYRPVRARGVVVHAERRRRARMGILALHELDERGDGIRRVRIPLDGKAMPFQVTFIHAIRQFARQCVSPTSVSIANATTMPLAPVSPGAAFRNEANGMPRCWRFSIRLPEVNLTKKFLAHR